MKKLLFFSLVGALLGFVPTYDTISKKERDFAVNLLKDTQQGVFDAVKGLSDAQLKFKPAPDRWSVEECLKHIAVTEQALWHLTDSVLRSDPNPAKRADIKATDEGIVKMLENRTTKVKTADPFKPENTPYTSAEDALNSFKTNREKLISFMKETQDDLRNHVVALGALGSLDTYQMVLFIASHSQRHTQQINEVKADPNFPKN
ncbi:MAG: DinB family protein [Bacteroidetes bacterium]|nr:MAG: DinB family protein [Bacteroidota bacterium]